VTPVPDAAGVRILVLNWQDRENPQAGGAEVHMHEIFGRLADRGHDVRAVVGGWPGAPERTTLDGIEVRRAGGRHTFLLHAARAVRAELRRRPADVVVEDINKIPLYAPRWLDLPLIALVPHLFGTTAFAEAAWPVGAAVWAAERGIARAYRGTPFEAISEGTAEDLVRRGIPRDRITVIPPGVDHRTFTPGPAGDRDEDPTLLYVGRLKRYKGIEVLFGAVERLEAGGRSVRLLLAGRGGDRPRLERRVRALGLTERVRFLGYVDEAEKVRLLRRAWVAVYPSPKEGWGIANVEAAACGTPVVASDSPGLRESVRHGESGFLVPHRDVGAWAAALEALLSDAELRARLGRGAIRHAAGFSWDRAADETERHIRETVRAGSRHGHPPAGE